MERGISKIELYPVREIMIRHIVMWKLKDFAEGCSREENALKIKARLEALKDKIEWLRHLEVGINSVASEMSYDAVLITEFEDVQALEAYKKHPEHVKVSEFVTKVRENRAVVDYIA